MLGAGDECRLPSRQSAFAALEFSVLAKALIASFKGMTLSVRGVQAKANVLEQPTRLNIACKRDPDVLSGFHPLHNWIACCYHLSLYMASSCCLLHSHGHTLNRLLKLSADTTCLTNSTHAGYSQGEQAAAGI